MSQLKAVLAELALTDINLDAGEVQALLKYHCQTIVEVIDDGGIKPSKIEELIRTTTRINMLAESLKHYPVESK